MDKKKRIEDAGYCFKTVKLFINTTEKPALCNCREKEGIKGGQQGTPQREAEELLINKKMTRSLIHLCNSKIPTEHHRYKSFPGASNQAIGL